MKKLNLILTPQFVLWVFQLVLMMLVFLLPTQKVQASCVAAQNPLETTFGIDPNQHKILPISRQDYSLLPITGCSGSESKYLQLAIENLFYENDIRANEFLLGQKFTKSCEIKSEIGLQPRPILKDEAARQERQNFVKKCLSIAITEQGGQKIEYPLDQKYCSITAVAANQSSLILKGPFCYVKTNPRHEYATRILVNPDCLKLDYLTTEKIFSKDIETRLLVRETSDNSGKSQATTGIVAYRNVRYSILPGRGLLPTAAGDDASGFEYVSILATNMHQGPIAIRNLGLDRSQVDVKYLAEHYSDSVCTAQKGCSSVADYNAPVVSHVNFSLIKNGQKTALKDWYAPFRLPPQWSGIVTPLFNVNLGSPVSLVLLDHSLHIGDQIEVVSEFYEPRTLLEILKYDSGISDGNYGINVDLADNSGSLPNLPRLAAPKLSLALPRLPSIQLGSGEMNWNRLDLQNRGEWTHYYEKVCDVNNSNCQRLKGADQAFTVLTTTIELGPPSSTGEFTYKNIRTIKTSKTFGSYNQNLSELPRRNCDLPLDPTAQ